MHVCETCGERFAFCAYPSQIALGRGRFCSKDCQKRWQTVPLKERFQRYIGPTTERGCVLWTGTTNADGYGLIGSGTQKGKNILAHRLAYEFANGPVPEALSVLHSCDNPPCINPAHLFLGTTAVNCADMIAKDRHIRGQRSHFAKLTDEIVLAMRAQYAQGGISRRELAKRFGTSVKTVDTVIRRDTWKHI